MRTSGTTARRLLATVLDASLGRLGAALFWIAAKLRRGRPVHGSGRAFGATVDTDGHTDLGPSILASPATYAAVVRASRGLGRKEPRPDGLAIALRILNVDEAHGDQELLLAASFPSRLGRRFLAMSGDFGSAFHTTVGPMRIGGRRWMIAVRPRWTSTPLKLARFDDLERAALAEEVVFDLLIASALSARWRRVAVITLREVLPQAESDALQFDAFRDAGGLEPVGFYNAWRRRSYALIQRMRDEAAARTSPR